MARNDPLLVLAFLILILGVAVFTIQQPVSTQSTEEFGLVPTKNPGELQEYVRNSQQYTGYATIMTAGAPLTAAAGAVKSGATPPQETQSSTPERTSTTNVQVVGVDEPDVLKLAGNKAFYQSRGNVKIIHIYPPRDANVLAKLPANWGTKLFVEGNTLIILQGSRITGYDVSDPANPRQEWELDVNGSVRDAREINGTIYVITSDYRVVCPYYPVKGIIIPCTHYYHPTIPLPSDVTYTVLKINGKSGNVEKAVALSGSYQTTVYVSKNAIYFAYRIQKPIREVLYDFIIEKGDEVLPRNIVEHLRKVNSYDISKEAKIAEMEAVLENYYEGLSPEEQSNAQNRVEKALEEYLKENAGKIDSTGIAKISLDDLSITATGKVPGHLLNQWSMDEHDGYLRVATTTTANWRNHIGNNLYVLDGKLNVIGKVEGLEEGERIYAVRFMGSKAYVVTYRETDPLLVLDISDPRNPRVEGELKIPGYSTYLHPIDQSHMIGVGRGDNWKIKVSLFDVSDPENPKELDTYYLKEGWGQVLFDHHAFLWDEKHELLIIPAGNRYYLLRVRTDEKPYINAVKIVGFDSTAKRAAYMDDYVYLFSDDEMAAIDENSGEVVKRLQIEDGYNVGPFPPPRPIPIIVKSEENQ